MEAAKQWVKRKMPDDARLPGPYRLETCDRIDCMHLRLLTRRFPKNEQYGLSSQLRRASVSVASNIAEGRGRLSVMEFRQFLAMAHGSIYELQTQLIVAKSLGLGEKEDLAQALSLSNEVSKMLTALIKGLSVGITKKKLEARS